ncbi:MAG: PipX family protein [Prochlorococcus sp.]|nr:PipX family protein [Prochlorococcaceae cyanobacterium ETNP2_MAG_10]MDP6196945.1 PipX family protein [Prochlorococcaceae cyanobacterium ETNP18_MAG_17]MDP6322123.1 PipX family protein [Prochlorococcaceae cyanobacterium ETNP14_MAG_5]MDP7327622.1 PipX family protein [Prochlorococcaceae cyanobacterium ETNP7_MAG_30]HJL68656.1 PipX family protein [Prochlorococcaceae cyanobacterium Gl_MAG_24]HJO78002.1 PipX family protein [Prochlorococcaceae cyanobacterium Fu_MAG_134]
MGVERYLNHPTFGMLYLVAPAGDGRDVYATLYAQRMFFLVTLQPRGAQFEVIPYQDARHYAELHLSRCRRDRSPEAEGWQQLFAQTFI